MRTGIALSRLQAGSPTKADIRTLLAMGADCVRLEVTSALDPTGYAEYLATTALEPVWLLGEGLIPGAELRAGARAFAAALTLWERAVHAALARLAGARRAGVRLRVELWNEPNAGEPITPVRYRALVNAAAPLVAAAASAQHQEYRVIAGGLFVHRGVADFAPYLVGAPWHQAVTHQGMHLYPNSNSPVETALVHSWLEAAFHVSGRRVWVTETGWDTHITTPAMQADNVAAMLTLCRACTLVDGVLIFTLADAPMAAPPLFFGIHGKPAQARFQLACTEKGTP